MDGLLSDHPLAEIIHELSGGRMSGVLRVSRERAKGAVYFDEVGSWARSRTCARTV